jgi:sigma-B regulation protein RsbU (phosphoserine phosphatase)
MALGIVRGIELEQKTVQLSQGDLVLFYTDGVTDALNDEVQEFGLERLKSVVEAHRHESARAVVQAIDQAVSDFVGRTPQFDDLTLVVLKQQEERVDD